MRVEQNTSSAPASRNIKLFVDVLLISGWLAVFSFARLAGSTVSLHNVLSTILKFGRSGMTPSPSLTRSFNTVRLCRKCWFVKHSSSCSTIPNGKYHPATAKICNLTTHSLNIKHCHCTLLSCYN
jgi:hypothetical protein